MNEDLSDVFNKFSEILKEKDIDLNNIGGGTNSSPTESQDMSFDIETIFKIKNIISKINQNHSCPRNNLLHALKPYLENTKQEKLEQYIKSANLLNVMEDLDLGFNLLDKNKQGYDFILIITLLLLLF